MKAISNTKILIALFFSFNAQVFAQEVFKFRIAEDRGTLDWGNGEVNQDVVLQMMEGLTSSGSNGEAISAAAQKWEFNPKASTYIFHLRKESKWSDGKDLCAQDFVSAWKRVLDKNFSSPYAHLLSPLKSFYEDGCKKLIVNLYQPLAFFPELVSHWVYFPIRDDLLRKYGAKYFTHENLTVNGPYKLISWKRDQKYVLEKNMHFREKAGPERLEAVVVQDDATAVRLFEKDELHWIRDLPFLDTKRLSARKEFKLSPTLVVYYFGFSFQDSPLSKEERCLISRAIDRKQIPVVLSGAESPAYGFGLNSTVLPVGIEKNKKMNRGFLINYYSKDIHQPLMEWLQTDISKNLKTIVALAKNEGKNYWSMLSTKPPAVFLSGSTAPYPHPHALLSEFHSSSKANWGRFKSKKFDETLDKIAVAKKNELPRLVKEAEKILFLEECAAAPLYFRQTSHLVSLKWKGFHMNPLARTYLNRISSAPP